MAGLGKSFQVRFWGVRGSYPTSGYETLKFGGHTSCVEAEVGGHRLIFDAGTGIIPLGKELVRKARRGQTLHLFLSHTHHDHLIGLYFFEPLLNKSNRFFVFGPNCIGQPLRETLQAAMGTQFFPIGFQDLDARKEIYSLKGGETIRFKARSQRPKVQRKFFLAGEAKDEVRVLAYKSSAHPKNGVMLYRINYRDKSAVYATDIEEKRGGYPEVIEFARGADLLIHDAMYLSSEYSSRANSRRGWGHSTMERAVEVARKAEVKRLILFHHEPTHDDQTLREMEKQARRLFPNTLSAYEGMRVSLL